ncbi:hypothetical protein I4U23_029367 [Adineta vaga]|nr:hypothetical protein I4U23_029367 [Adineta vaga]
MSRQKPERETRTVEYWAGRPFKRSSSDLFLDRPGPSNTVFSGPNALWFNRIPSREHIGDVGEGQASILRSLDVSYLTRGYNIEPPLRRSAYPGEIGWTATFFNRQYQQTRPYSTWHS